MGNSDVLYMLGSLQKWSNLRIPKLEGLTEMLSFENLGVGYLPVFESLEAFQRAHPGETPIPIQLKAPAEETQNGA